MQSIFVVALLSTYGYAWWCDGHMAIAQIAKSRMSSSTIDYAESIIKKLSDDGPFDQSPDMVQAACWADDLKSQGLHPMAGWHFYNQPYSADGTPIPNNVVQQENVAELIEQLDSTLKSRPKAWILSFALANLLHFYGDSHQPLHVIEMFSRTYPKGDHGGNEQQVEVDGTWTKLHFIWDAVCWKFPNSAKRPLSSSDRAFIESYAAHLIDTYKFTDAQINVFNASVFVDEGYQEAIKYAYPGVQNGTYITQDYRNKCLPVAEARLTLAGLRLGNELEFLLRDRVSQDPKDVAFHIIRHTLNKYHDARRRHHRLERV